MTFLVLLAVAMTSLARRRGHRLGHRKAHASTTVKADEGTDSDTEPGWLEALKKACNSTEKAVDKLKEIGGPDLKAKIWSAFDGKDAASKVETRKVVEELLSLQKKNYE